LAYPLAKKFGIRNIAMAGFSLVLLGSILGWIFSSDVTMAMAAGFLRQTGMIPNAYIAATLLCFAFDSVEHKSGFRLEGLIGVSIIAAIQAAIYAPFAGGYEASILKRGFVDVMGVTPNSAVLNFMLMAFYLFDIILAVAYLVLLPFMDVEKHLPQINAELKERRKKAVLARGEEWIEPEEQERREKEQYEKHKEENRIADLMEICRKKNLNFETENAKYLAKMEVKKRRQEGRKNKKR
jgi:GPH family glycoside/pentoside/hexuronide:cation symporter